jgi:hypothetical protein
MYIYVRVCKLKSNHVSSKKAHLILAADAASTTLAGVGPAQTPTTPATFPIVACRAGALRLPAAGGAALAAVPARQVGAGVLVTLPHLDRLD